MPDEPNGAGPTGLSRKQERAILALLSEPTVKRAAALAGVGESTLWKWLSDQSFHSAFLEARRRTTEQGIARIQQMTSKATTLLESFLDDDKLPPNTRLNAVKFIVQSALTGLDLEEQSNRLEDLINRLKEPANGPHY